MTTDSRKTGISVVGDRPWGTHFCHFYDTKEDLLGTLVPYFKAGLEAKEFCVWVTSEPLTEQDARNALREAVPELDRHTTDGNIKVFLGRDWYLKDGAFDLRRVRSECNDKLNQALARGYAGMRFSGNTAWLEKKDWKDFCEYEKELNETIAGQHMTVLCTYPLAASGASELLDVVSTHQFAIAKRKGAWEMIETPELKQAKTEIKKLNKELERRVAERTKQLRLLVESVKDYAIFGLDPSGCVASWNAGAEHIKGYKAEEIIGEHFSRFYPLESLKSGDPEIALQVAAEQGRFEQEGWRVRKDGSRFWADVVITALRDPQRKLVGYSKITRDLTERRRTEAEALALKDELAVELSTMKRWHEFSTRLLANTELDPILNDVLNAVIELLSADFGNVQLYNPETKALEIVAQRGFQQDFLDYFKCVRDEGAACGRALLQGNRVIIEDVLSDPGYEPHRQIAASAGFRAVQSTPLFSRSGEPLGMLSTHFREPHRFSERELRFTDLYARFAAELIERSRAEEALRASEKRSRRYFELGLIGMAMTSPTMGILEVNDELCHILGYERGELLKNTWAEMTHPDDLAADVAQFNRVMAGDSDCYTLDKRWIRKDGRVIDSIISAKCLRRADGSVEYFVGLVQDITERKRLEQTLLETQTKLAHLSRALTMGELTSSIAHEVNQPLAAIVMNGEACLRWLTGDPLNLDRARDSVARIIDEGNRASEVINRIRALVKKTPPDKTSLDVKAVIGDLIDLLSAELAKNQVSLQVDLASDIPLVLGDPIQLQQVILNLIANGIEAMSSVTERPRELLISSKASKEDGVLISVCDSGTGFEPGSGDHLFEAFFTTKHGGMGLGLSISRTIVEAHGGRLWATANSNHGSTFQFTLPRVARASA